MLDSLLIYSLYLIAWIVLSSLIRLGEIIDRLAQLLRRARSLLGKERAR